VEVLVERVRLELGALALGRAEHRAVAVVGAALAEAAAVLGQRVAGVLDLDELAVLDHADLDALELHRAALLEAGDLAEVGGDRRLLLPRALALADHEDRQDQQEAHAEHEGADDQVEAGFFFAPWWSPRSIGPDGPSAARGRDDYSS
jgi:hypothetical protein